MINSNYNNINVQNTYSSNTKDTKIDTMKINETIKNEEIKPETKVERIKREIEYGTYKLDINKTANKMLESLIK